MFNLADLVQKKSIWSMNYIYRNIIYLSLIVNFGIKYAYFDDEKSLFSTIQFLLALLLVVNGSSVSNDHYDDETLTFKYESKGEKIPIVMVVISSIKMISEVTLKIAYKAGYFNVLAIDDSIMSKLFNTDNYENDGQTLNFIVGANSLDLILLSCMIAFNSLAPNEIMYSQLYTIRKLIKLVTYPMKILVYICFFIEFYGMKITPYTMIYIVLIYVMIFNQVKSVKSNKKVHTEEFVSIVKYTMIFCFVMKDAVLFYKLIFGPPQNIMVNIIFESTLNSLFWTKLLMFYCGESYIYFKHRLKCVDSAISAGVNKRVRELSKKRIHKSYFSLQFLRKIGEITESFRYYDEKKNARIQQKALNKYFSENKLIKTEIRRLREIELNSKGKTSELASSLRMLSKKILGIFISNIGDTFKYINYYQILMICSNSDPKELSWPYYRLFDISLLIWVVIALSFSQGKIGVTLLLRIGLFFVFPSFVFSMILNRITILRVFLYSDTSVKNNFDQIFVSQLITKRVLSFGIFIINSIIQLAKENIDFKSTAIGRFLLRKDIVKGEIKETKLEIMIKRVFLRIVSFSRFICLCSTLYASLIIINLANTLLLTATLYYFWTKANDKATWNIFMKYLIFLMLLSFTAQFFPFNILKFSQEYVSIFGVSKLAQENYSQQFRAYFLGFFSGCMYEGYYGRVFLSSESNLPDLPSLKRIISNIEKVARIFYYDYMIWVYHIGTYSIFYLNKTDTLNFAVIIVHIIMFFIHLRVYYTTARNVRNTRLIKYWYPCFLLILMMALFKYLSFYIRYSVIRFPLERSLGVSLDESKLFRLLLRIGDSSKYDNLQNEFLQEILLLGLTILTLVSLSKKSRDKYIHKKKESNVYARMLISGALNAADSGLSGISNKSLIIDRKLNELLISAPKDEKNLHSSVLLDTPLLEKVMQDDNSFEEEIEEPEYFAHPDKLYPSKNVNLVYIELIWLLGRALTFTVTVALLSSEPTTADCVFIASDLLYFNILFWNIASTFKLFNVESFISNQLKYFRLSFVKLLDFNNAFDNDLPPIEHMAIYCYRDNRHFIKQLAIAIRREINRATTYVNIMKLLVLIYLIMNYFLNDLISVNSRQVNIYSSEGLKRAGILALVLADMFILKNYIVGDSSLKMQRPDALGKFMLMLETKLEYLSAFSSVKYRDYKIRINSLSIPELSLAFKTRFSQSKNSIEIMRINVTEYLLWRTKKESSLRKLLMKKKNFVQAFNNYQQLETDDMEQLNPADFCFDNLKSISKNRIEKLISSNDNDDKEDKKIRIIQSEGISKLHKFLFIHRNVHKLSYCQLVKGGHNLMRRLVLIPLLYSAFTYQNPLNIFVLIPAYFYISKKQDTIEGDIYIFMPIFSLVFALMFSYRLVYPYLVKLLPWMSFKQPLVENLAYLSCFIPVIAVSLCLTLYLVYFVAVQLFINRKRLKTLYFYFGDEKSAANKLFIKFRSWKRSSLFWVTGVIQFIILKCHELYLLLVFLLNIYDKSKVNIFLLLGTITMSLFQYLEGYRNKSLKDKTPRQISKFTKILVIVIFTLNLLFNLVITLSVLERVSYLGNFISFIIPYITFESGMSSFGLVAFLTLLLMDLLLSKPYIEDISSYDIKKRLKAHLIALNEAYSINEQKIFERVKLMCKMNRLKEIEQIFWDNELNLQNINFDFKYWHRDFTTSIKNSILKLRKIHLTPKTQKKYALSHFIYSRLVGMTSEHLFDDTICSLLKVFSKNSFLMKNHALDIEDFYSGRIYIYSEYLAQIDQFFHRLKRKSEDENNLYNKVFSEEIRNEKVKEEAEPMVKDDLLQSYNSLDLDEYEDIGLDSSYSVSNESLALSNENNGIQNLNFSNLKVSWAVFQKSALFLSSNAAKRLSKVEEIEEEHIPSENLIEASNILLERLTNDSERKFSITSEMKNVDSFECAFGDMRVIFYDVSNNFINETNGYVTLKLMVILTLVYRSIITNLEMVVSIIIIFMQVINGALENVIVLGIVFFLILAESSRGNARWWRVLYIIIMAKCTIKFMAFLFMKDLRNSSKDFSIINPLNPMIVIFGTLNYQSDIFCLLLIFVLLQVLSIRGFSERKAMSFEDPGTAISRLLLSRSLNRVFDDPTKHIMCQNNIENEFIMKNTEMAESLGKKSTKRVFYKLDFIKQRIQGTVLQEYFRKEFIKNLKIYTKRVRNDIFWASEENIDSFQWRNFSVYARLKGADLDSICNLALMTCLVLAVVTVPMIVKNPRTILQLILADKMIGTATIILLFITITLIIDSVINKKMNPDIVGLTRTPFMFAQLKRMNVALKTTNLFAHPYVKLRRAVRKLRTMFTMMKNVNEKPDYIDDNPMRRKFILAAVFFFIFNFIVYVLIVLEANEDSNVKGFEALACFFNVLTNQCRSENEWIMVRIIYFSGMIYVFLAVLQVHFGKSPFESQIINFSIFTKIAHQIYGFIPFGREFSIGTDFLSNRSALQLTHKLIYNDIQHVLRSAKYSDMARQKTSFGKTNTLVQRIIVMIAVSFFSMTVIFGPLLLFAVSNSKVKPYVIEEGSMRVYVVEKDGIPLGDIFHSTMNYKTTNSSILEYTKENMMIEDGSLTPDYFYSLNLSTRANLPHNIQDKFFYFRHRNDMAGIIEQLKNGALIFELAMNVVGEGIFTYRSELKIESSSKITNDLADMILMDCNLVSYKKTIFLNRIPLILKVLAPENSTRSLKEPVSQKMTIIDSKLSIRSDCSSEKGTIFNLETDKFNSGYVEFAIISLENRSSVSNLVQDIVGFRINIIVLYVLLFRVFGVNLIRKMIFNQQSRLWFTQIPEPEKIICLLDLITYAQLEGDFMREEMLFFFLVDLLRNPEHLYLINGSVRNHQYEVFIKERRKNLLG